MKQYVFLGLIYNRNHNYNNDNNSSNMRGNSSFFILVFDPLVELIYRFVPSQCSSRSPVLAVSIRKDFLSSVRQGYINNKYDDNTRT